MFRFEKLTAWQKAIDFADAVYDATAGFPTDERFGLTSQLRRAAVSISSNLAEGNGRNTNEDYARFVGIAYGSLMETVNQLVLAHRRGFLPTDVFKTLYDRADELARILSGLRASLLRPQP